MWAMRWLTHSTESYHYVYACRSVWLYIWLIRVMSLILTSQINEACHIKESCHRTCMGVCIWLYQMCSAIHVQRATWLIHTWDMTHSYMGHECMALPDVQCNKCATRASSIRFMSPFSISLLWGMWPIIVYMMDTSRVMYVTKSCHLCD